MDNRREFLRKSLILSGAAGLFTTLPSCQKFLTRNPPTSISSGAFFKTEKDLELYSNGFLQSNMPTPETLTFGDQYADNIATTKSTVFLTGVWTADQQDGWSISTWGKLKNVNYFLEHVDEVTASEDIKNHYQGVGRFWRAWFYYGMVRNFGDVPWYDKPIDPSDTEALDKARDPRATVMDHVLEDLTYAGEHCSGDDQFVKTSSRINKWTALAFKSRVCLFEGTYRKYHTELGLTDTADTFLQAAADAAKELMDNGPFSLVSDPGKVQTQYRSLFISEAVQTREVILANTYSDSASRWHNITRQYNTASYGNRWSLTKQFVNTYLMTDGSRFTDKSGYDTMSFTEEVQNRDYRLSQTVRTPGFTRTVKGKASTPVAPDFSVTLTGYEPIKWCLDDDVYDTNDTCNNSLSVFRYGEVLLNYAEAMAELGKFDETAWNATIKLLRERAGVAGTTPQTADPYLAAYYGGQVTDKWILEVRRERGIELVLENLRYDDIMRWKMGNLLTLPWYGIYVPAQNTPYDLNSDGKKDVAFVSADHGKIADVYNVNLGSGYALKDGDKGNVEYQFKRIWDDKKYLHPIPQDAINQNPKLTQNDGWDM